MTKPEWEEAYKEFDQVSDRLYWHERDYFHGSNAKKRKAAGQQMEYAKSTVKYLFSKYPEVRELAFGNHDSTARHFAIEEFYSNTYIVHDVRMLLIKIDEKIKSFPDEQKIIPPVV